MQGKKLKLTKVQCVTGIEKSFENALALIEDAKLLLKKGSFGHSVALSMLAIEECGKAMFLVSVYDEETELDKQTFHMMFRNHVSKLYLPLLELALSKNFPKVDVEYIKTLAPTLNLVKQRGLYVNFLEGKWVTPQDSDLENIANVNLNYTERVINGLSEVVKNIQKS